MDLLNINLITTNSGIYLLINNINNHKYIGLAKNIRRRIRDHLNVSNNSNYQQYNTPLHQAIRKYGKNNFSLIILEEYNDYNLELLNKREQYWIKYYNTFLDNSHYNLTQGGDGTLGRKFSEQEKENKKKQMLEYYKTEKGQNKAKRHSLAMQGKNNPQYKQHSNGRSVLCIETGQVYPSAREAARNIGRAHTGIISTCNGKQQTCGGYHWQYYELDEEWVF